MESKTSKDFTGSLCHTCTENNICTDIKEEQLTTYCDKYKKEKTNPFENIQDKIDAFQMDIAAAAEKRFGVIQCFAPHVSVTFEMSPSMKDSMTPVKMVASFSDMEMFL